MNRYTTLFVLGRLSYLLCCGHLLPVGTSLNHERRIFFWDGCPFLSFPVPGDYSFGFFFWKRLFFVVFMPAAALGSREICYSSRRGMTRQFSFFRYVMIFLKVWGEVVT